MTTENEYKIKVRELYVKLEQLWGKEELIAWWQRNVIATRDYLTWNYAMEYSVLDQEYQCLMHLHDQLFQSMIDERDNRQYAKAAMQEEGLP